MSTPWRRIVLMQVRQVLAARAVQASLLLFLLAGVLGLGYGHTVIARQRAALAGSPALQAEQHAATLAHVRADAKAADQLYYLFFHTAHVPQAWAPFAIGQRDMQPFNLKVRLLALHGQLYAGELINPLIAAAGHFDAAFVLVWLAPLLVIALLHGLWAEEREQGTWPLLRLQAPSPFAVLVLTWAGRVACALAACLSLVGLAVLVWRLPLDGRLLTVALLTVLHVLFWSGLALLVAARGWSSQVNALVSIGLWLLLAVVAPGLITVFASAQHPLPETMALTVQQRHGYHAAWDRPLADTMAQFYQRYPSYAAATVPTSTYSNAWYYAMQQAGDDAAAPAAARYFEALERRRAFSRRLALWIPPAALQLALTQVARTDLDSHIGYLQSVAAYHEQMKQQFLPAIFDGRPVAAVDWARLPRHQWSDPTPPQTAAPLASLSVLAGLTLLLGARQLRRALDTR